MTTWRGKVSCVTDRVLTISRSSLVMIITPFAIRTRLTVLAGLLIRLESEQPYQPRRRASGAHWDGQRNQSLAGEGVTFHDVERARVQGKTAELVIQRARNARPGFSSSSASPSALPATRG